MKELVCYKPNVGVWHIPLSEVEYLCTDENSNLIQIHLKSGKVQRASNIEFV